MTTFPKCGPSTRLAMLAGAVLLASPFVIALRLQPATAGLGTHQQLGLPPCTTRVLWGVRCPACGMTTAWAHLVRGHFWESLSANSGGTSLGLVTIGMAITLTAHALAGQSLSRRWLVVTAWGLSVSLILALSDWAWRLSGGG